MSLLSATDSVKKSLRHCFHFCQSDCHSFSPFKRYFCHFARILHRFQCYLRALPLPLLPQATTDYQYASASSISCAALCTLYTPGDAQLIWRTLYNLQPPDSHVLIYGLSQHQPIYFLASRPSLVSVHSRTLVHPCGTHCPPTFTTFLTLTLSESF